MLTQSPASHKISFQAERAPSLLESYPGTAVQVQREGGEGKGQKAQETQHSREERFCWNEEPQFIKTENRSLKLVN